MTPLDDFTRGYIECMLWAESANYTDETRDDTSFEAAGYDGDDIALEALERIKADCADFQDANAAELEAYCATLGKYLEYSAMERAGHDFWLTRNGHGAGFWDHGLGELGERLSAAAKVYGEAYLYLGDDGLIYHD